MVSVVSRECKQRSTNRVGNPLGTRSGAVCIVAVRGACPVACELCQCFRPSKDTKGFQLCSPQRLTLRMSTCDWKKVYGSHRVRSKAAAGRPQVEGVGTPEVMLKRVSVTAPVRTELWETYSDGTFARRKFPSGESEKGTHFLS